MIKPTVGRIVWYNPAPKDNLELLVDDKGKSVGQPLAAMVLAVHNDTRVNLMVYSAYGQSRFMSRVELWQGDNERPKGHGYAEWMPYQKAVAEGKIQPLVHADPTISSGLPSAEQTQETHAP